MRRRPRRLALHELAPSLLVGNWAYHKVAEGYHGAAVRLKPRRGADPSFLDPAARCERREARARSGLDCDFGDQQEEAARGLGVEEQRLERRLGTMAPLDEGLELAPVRFEATRPGIARPGPRRPAGAEGRWPGSPGSRRSRGPRSAAWPTRPKPVMSVAAWTPWREGGRGRAPRSRRPSTAWLPRSPPRGRPRP